MHPQIRPGHPIHTLAENLDSERLHSDMRPRMLGLV